MDLQSLIQAYLDSELTEQQFAALSDWLAADEANREAFVRATALDTQLYQQLTQSDLNQFLDQVDIHSLQSALEQSASNKSGVFAAEINQVAAKPSDEISFKDAVAVLSHAGADLARKGIRKHAVPLALAAALALVAAIALVFMGGDEQPTPGVAERVDEQQPAIELAVEVELAVARLTNERGAQWQVDSGSASPSVNDALSAGQRLTLTQGFAEITTTRGAVAIIEAPASIELLDNDNAIRLHTGKLVGICETESSKGFLVRTPHMDITDLGTRFGVVVEELGNTLAQVFDGKVVVTPKTQSGIAAKPIELVGGEAHAVDTAGQAIAPQRFEADAFTSLRLAGSGVVSLAGEADLAPRPIADSDTAAAQKGRVTLYQELRGHRLASAIGLTFATPGRHNDFKETRSSVPAGTVIRTYILWHPNSGEENLTRGSVTFEGEVLGAVANERDWQAFVDATQSDAERVCKSGRHAGLESVPAGSEKPNEQFTLSDDRKTLQFQFRSGPTDALRVIVREPAGEQP